MEREKVFANLADIARMLEIASKLGRLATGLGTDDERRKGEELPSVRIEVYVALEKIYGQPLPEEVATPAPIGDVEEVKKAELQSPALCRDAATEKKQRRLGNDTSWPGGAEAVRRIKWTACNRPT